MPSALLKTTARIAERRLIEASRAGDQKMLDQFASMVNKVNPEFKMNGSTIDGASLKNIHKDMAQAKKVAQIVGQKGASDYLGNAQPSGSIAGKFFGLPGVQRFGQLGGDLSSQLNTASASHRKNISAAADMGAEALDAGDRVVAFGAGLSTIGDGVRSAGAQLKAYGKWMNQGTAGQVATKYGVTAGAYMGANMAGRAISGGGLTYNNEGRRDIAGIPIL